MRPPAAIRCSCRRAPPSPPPVSSRFPRRTATTRTGSPSEQVHPTAPCRQKVHASRLAMRAWLPCPVVPLFNARVLPTYLPRLFIWACRVMVQSPSHQVPTTIGSSVWKSPVVPLARRLAVWSRLRTGQPTTSYLTAAGCTAQRRTKRKAAFASAVLRTVPSLIPPLPTFTALPERALAPTPRQLAVVMAAPRAVHIGSLIISWRRPAKAFCLEEAWQQRHQLTLRSAAITFSNQ